MKQSSKAKPVQKILFLVIASLLYGMIGVSIPALGADRTDNPLYISVSHPTDEKTYGPLAGNDPELILVHPEDCKVSPSCDTVEVTLDIPEDLLYRIIITTMWEGEDVTGTYVPDIDVYIWEATTEVETDATTGQPVTETTYEQIASSASASMPEIAKVADLLPSSDLKRYYITPVLWAGNPSDYTIKVEFYTQTVTRRPSPSPTPRRTQSPPVTVNTAKTTSPKPSPSPVKVPGDTGPLEDMELQALEERFEGESRGPNRAPLIAGSLGLLVLAGGIFIFFFMRARRRAATT